MSHFLFRSRIPFRLFISSTSTFLRFVSCSPDLRGEQQAVSSGKTLSFFIRSAVHVVISFRAHLPSLFDRRVFSTTPIFRYFCLFPFRSRFASYAPRLVSFKKSPRFISLQTTPAFIAFSLSAAFVLSTLTAVALSLSRFSTHFFAFPLSSNSPPSRPLSRPFVISLQPSYVRFCFTDPLYHCLSFSISNPRVSLFNVTLCTVSSFSNHHSLPLSTTLSMPCLFLPFSL